MNKDTLILADGTVVELESGASLNSMSVLFSNKEEMESTWNMLTDSNLAEVQIKNKNGLVVANYTNLVLVNETSVINEDGTILTHFKLREKTQIELDVEELKSDMVALNEVLGDV